MTDLDDFLLFNACEDACVENEREDNKKNTFDSLWDSDSSDNDY